MKYLILLAALLVGCAPQAPQSGGTVQPSPPEVVQPAPVQPSTPVVITDPAPPTVHGLLLKDFPGVVLTPNGPFRNAVTIQPEKGLFVYLRVYDENAGQFLDTWGGPNGALLPENGIGIGPIKPGMVVQLRSAQHDWRTVATYIP